MVEDDVLDHELIVDEVSRTQDRGAKTHPFDHPLGTGFHREVRHVHEAIAVDHRQIDDPLDACLASDVQRDERLGEFVSRHRIEQEQRVHAGERGAQRVDIEQVALHDLHAGRKAGLRGIADEDAHVGAALDELLDDLAADTAGGAGNEDGHGITPVWGQKTPCK